MTRSVMIIGLIGGSLFLLAGFLSLLPWAVSGSIAGVLLGSWFGGEIKKRLDRVNEEGKETRVIRFRKKALLEDNVSKMRTAGWEPRWESYRETQRPSSPPDHILGRNGEETAKTRPQRAQTTLELPIPRQESTKRIPTIFNPKYVVHPDSRFSKIVEIIRDNW